MALPDFNGDGVKEIAVMHGGNPTKDSNVRIKTYTVKIEICRSIKNKKKKINKFRILPILIKLIILVTASFLVVLLLK